MRIAAQPIINCNHGPIAWVVSCNENAFRATPLPLIGETDTAGRVVALFGHVALANPHVEPLRARPAATILFSGPNGYISPEAISQPQWAPTPHTRAEIIAALGQTDLARWMRDFNAEASE